MHSSAGELAAVWPGELFFVQGFGFDQTLDPFDEAALGFGVDIDADDANGSTTDGTDDGTDGTDAALDSSGLNLPLLFLLFFLVLRSSEMTEEERAAFG